MTKTYEIPEEKMIIADVDEEHHMATVSVYILDDLVRKVNKTGHWEKSSLNCEGSEDFWECSECGWEIYDHRAKTNYCPSCGAKMDEPQESEG